MRQGDPSVVSICRRMRFCRRGAVSNAQLKTARYYQAGSMKIPKLRHGMVSSYCTSRAERLLSDSEIRRDCQQGAHPTCIVGSFLKRFFRKSLTDRMRGEN